MRHFLSVLVLVACSDADVENKVITADTDHGSEDSAVLSSGDTGPEPVPSIDSVTLGPDAAVEGDTLICDYEGFYSPTGASDQSSIGWRINEVVLDSVGHSLSDGFSAGDAVTCTVTPDDGVATGVPQSDSLTLANRSRYDLTPVWPLCGRISEDPPMGWVESDGCPSERWNSTDHTDYPINSTFGPRQLYSADYRYDYHRGIDLSAVVGTPIFAVAPGEVVKAGEDASYADPVVQLRHYRPDSGGTCDAEGCWHTNYLHLSSWSVNAGDTVARGQLIGHTGASSSGYPHLHFEVRDARAEDPKSAWQRDTIHPLSVLPYRDGSSGAEITIEAVDTSNWTNPAVDAAVTFPSSMPELDMVRVEVRVYEVDDDGAATEILQSYESPWFVDPPFFDVNEWNLQYTHKNSSSFPWSGFSACPYAGEHGESYDAHIHMDRADPADHGVGLFNGVRVAPAFYNESTAEWRLALRFLGLTVPAETRALRFVAELTDARDNLHVSLPTEVSLP